MPTLRRRGERWYIRDSVGGRDIERATGCTTRKAAEAALRRYEHDRADPEGAARRRAEDVTVGALIEAEAGRHDNEVKAGRLAEGTRDFYRKRLGTLLRSFGAERSAATLDAAAVDAFIAQRRGEFVGEHTIHKELGVLRRMLAAARRAGQWFGDVGAVIPARFSPDYTPRDRWLTEREVRAVLAELSPARGAWVALAVGAGAEVAALERAERGDFNEDRATVRVRGTKNARRSRTVPLVLPVCAELVARAFRDGDGAEPLLLRPWSNNRRDLHLAARRVGCRRTGCLDNPERVSPCKREECQRAAVAPFSLHALRHSFATWHLASGASWDDVARVMGHAGTAMLHKVYGHLGAEELRSRLAGAIEAVSPGTASRYLPGDAAHGAHSAHGAHTPEPARKPRNPRVSLVPRDGIEPPTRGFSIPASTSANALQRKGSGDTAAAGFPVAPRCAPSEGLDALALAVLCAVDEGTPAGLPARALALAVLATEPPGSPRWTAAVEIIEGGPLRVRRAVMLAGEVLADAPSLSLARAHT